MNTFLSSVFASELGPVLVTETTTRQPGEDFSYLFSYGFLFCCALIIFFQVIIERRNSK